MVVATKRGMRIGDGPDDAGASRWHIVREVEGSLRQLGTDYIDLYYYYRLNDRILEYMFATIYT